MLIFEESNFWIDNIHLKELSSKLKKKFIRTFVYTDNDLMDIQKTFEYFKWELFYDKDENIIGISLDANYLDGNDNILLANAAKYVKDGCFIKLTEKAGVYGTFNIEYKFNKGICYKTIMQEKPITYKCKV